MSKHLLFAIALILASGCSFLRGKGESGGRSSAKASNTFHQRYYTITSTQGKLTCVPKEPLASLIGDPNHCERELTTCRTGMDAAAGRLTSDDETMFADMIERTEIAFAYECVGLPRPASGPENLHLLGLQGLGLMASNAYVDRIVAVDDVNRRGEPWHIAMRPDLAFALSQTGDRAQALPKLVELAHLEGTDHATRARIVLYVGRMDSNGVVDLCTKRLSEPTNDDLAQACAWYAARFAAADAVPLFAKPDNTLGLTGIRALGWSGDRKAVELVTRAMNPLSASDNARIAARVALLNLGKREALRDYINLLGGNAGPRKATNATPKLPSDELSREAALEVLALKNRAYDKDIIKALHRLTSDKNEETAMAANIALAYLGDDAAIGDLAQSLAGADDSLRMFILDNVGGTIDRPGRHHLTGGGGLLADTRLSSAIANTYESASMKAPGRGQAIAALAAMRAAMRPDAVPPPATVSR